MSDDCRYMKVALDEARKAMQEGNLPIGAVLVIDGVIIGTNRNNQVTNVDFFSHAESLLVRNYARDIRVASKEGRKIEVFTTLEPCLMCFGTLIHNRVNYITYGCPDPLAGVTHIEAPTEWYNRRWPIIRGGVNKDLSYQLITDYMREHSDIWENALRQYEDMRKRW